MIEGSATSISYVLMSSHSDASWLTVIKHRPEDLRRLAQDGFRFPEAPFGQQAFRKSFTELCRGQRIGSTDRIQLLTDLFDSYTNVLDLAEGANECAPSSPDLNAPERLESLICRLAFAALQVSNPPREYGSTSHMQNSVLLMMAQTSKTLSNCSPS